MKIVVNGKIVEVDEDYVDDTYDSEDSQRYRNLSEQMSNMNACLAHTQEIQGAMWETLRLLLDKMNETDKNVLSIISTINAASQQIQQQQAYKQNVPQYQLDAEQAMKQGSVKIVNDNPVCEPPILPKNVSESLQERVAKFSNSAQVFDAMKKAEGNI